MVRPEHTPRESADVARFRYHRALKRLLHCAMAVARQRPGSEGFAHAVDRAVRARDRLMQTHAQLVFAEARERDAAYRGGLAKGLDTVAKSPPYFPEDGEFAKGWVRGLQRAIKEIEGR